MSEYIDKKALLDEICRDNCERSYDGTCHNCRMTETIADFPAADVRPVVRCKDCRWGQMDDLGVMHRHKYHMHKNVDGFCDEGERKEPENENTYSSI